MLALTLSLAACGNSRRDVYRAQRFPAAPSGHVNRLEVYLAAGMTRQDQAWALESVRAHERAYVLASFATPPPARVYVYHPDYVLLTGLQRQGVLGYHLPLKRIHVQGRTIVQSPQIHVVCGSKVTLPGLTVELHQVTQGPDPYMQDPVMRWPVFQQLGRLTVQQLESVR